MTLGTAVVLIAIAACASCFFALAETALLALGGWRARSEAEQRASSGQAMTRLLAAPQDFLASIVLGNTLANAFIVGLGWWTAHEQRWPLWLALPALGAFLLLGCEVAPKALALRNPIGWAVRLAIPMLWFERGTRPVRRGAQRVNELLLAAVIPRSMRPQSGISDEDYTELIELAFSQGALDPSEKEIILQIISLDRRTAKDIMRPRAQMACIPDTLTVEEMVSAAKRFKQRRLPVYDETPDNIVGVLNTQMLLAHPEADLEEAFETPSFVPATMNLLQLFKSLQRQKRGLAIVVDEFGGTAGAVRMEDILEEILGPFREAQPAEGVIFEALGPGRWRVGGGMRVEDFSKAAGTAVQAPPGVETMGGLVVHLFEYVPASGETVRLNQLSLTVARADARRVRELGVEFGGAERVSREGAA